VPSAVSILDDHAVDPHAARVVLDRLRLRSHEGLIGSLCAVLAAVVAGILGHFALAVPLAIGAIAGVFVAMAARSDRRALVVHLVGQRSAYAIPEVAEAALTLVTPARRRVLARRMTRLVTGVTGLEPAGEFVLEPIADRVDAHADDLLAVAFLVARLDRKLHPASAALLERLLASPERSPLFNERVPEQHLRIALQRVRTSAG
jgi:hypothetical protein